MFAFDVTVLGMPSHLIMDPFVIWKMDTVLTVPLTQPESNVKDASQATLEILQENQNVLVGKYTNIY